MRKGYASTECHGTARKAGYNLFAQNATASGSSGEHAGFGLIRGTHGKTLSMHGVRVDRAKNAGESISRRFSLRSNLPESQEMGVLNRRRTLPGGSREISGKCP